MLGWILAQLTLGQAYNPSSFRDIGVGVINGSLWTLTVEIIFYAIVPFIVYLESKPRLKYIVIVLTICSLVFYSLGPSYLAQEVYRNKTLYDFLS